VRAVQDGGVTDLDTVLAQHRADAVALRRNGEVGKAELIERLVASVEASAGDWLTWVSEADAILRSGHSRTWWLAAFKRLQPRGHARQIGRAQRIYRLAIVPMRKGLLDAASEGRRVARALEKAA
jgi:hypothetical protein